jgi:hypothetical protein
MENTKWKGTTKKFVSFSQLLRTHGGPTTGQKRNNKMPKAKIESTCTSLYSIVFKHQHYFIVGWIIIFEESSI